MRNYYLDGVAGILGSILSMIFYGCLRMRISFIVSVSATLVGAIFLLLLQQDYLTPNGISVFMPEDKRSPYPEDSE